jgi:hypothetical protein
MTADRWTPPGYYVNGSSTTHAGPCAHCGRDHGEHPAPQRYCPAPPRELQRPDYRSAA